MRAVTWHGRHDVRVDTVPDPEIVNPRDAIIRITSTAICGSDLHLYDAYIPGMRAGDILGHENMGEVVEVGAKSTLKKGQKVVIPFTISCGDCFFCKKSQFSACDNSNPAETADASETLMGHPMGAVFGYAHLTGGYAGGQAEYLRVPYSDVGPIVVPDGVDDDKVLFLSDILPTGWMAAENADIEDGDTVAVWGCGPVGLFAIQSALILGAHRVIAIDHYPSRLQLAKQMGAEILDYREVDVRDALNEMTGGIGPDAVIDCVGMESHGLSIDNLADTVKAHLFLGTERPHALRQAILACRKGGRVSIPGVYGGFADKFPLGQMMEKGLTVKQGQTHVQKYTHKLLEMIQECKLDTTFLISHHAGLEDAPDMYRHWHDDQNEYTKIVLKPGMEQGQVETLRSLLMSQRKFAIVTGASSGIGLEIAKLAAADGYDLLVAADEPLVDAAAAFKDSGVEVRSVEADLATEQGVKQLLAAAGDRPVDVLVANAGHGLGHAFLDQSPERWRHVIDTNITGTLLLVQPVVRQMVERGEGRVLIVGSIAGHLAGSFHAVYNGSKAFVDSFAAALGNEIKYSGVTVTCLKPGATDTDFFERAEMEDTKVGASKKDDPADVAATGWKAALEGEASVIYGLKNKMQVAAAGMMTDAATARLHRKQAEPGSGKE